MRCERFACVCSAILQLVSAAAHAGSTKTTLHAFKDTDGAGPITALTADASGALYGTTDFGGSTGGGSVFRLTRPAAGSPQWTEKVLQDFPTGSDGPTMVSELVPDSSGALYGTTASGGAYDDGDVFKLTPPVGVGTKWMESVIYSFTGLNDGGHPLAGLTAGRAGVLYGTTEFDGQVGAGTVFRMTPPARGGTAWTETVLYSFLGGTDGRDPTGRLLLDGNGALYGVTLAGGGPEFPGGGAGTVFRLTPPAEGSGPWTETVLHAFRGGADGQLPTGNLVRDGTGALYGATNIGGELGFGSIFKLTPPSPGHVIWKNTILHAFRGGVDGKYPDAGLVADASGALYGTTGEGGAFDCGTVFKLTPPAPGFALWKERVLHTFRGGSDGSGPEAGLIIDAAGTLYGTTVAGGRLGFGTVFQVVP